jgi:hypothetical protein
MVQFACYLCIVSRLHASYPQRYVHPSSKPSVSPSISLAPSLSISPSVSMYPTITLPLGFSLVGNGYCLDSSNQLYSYIGETFPAGISDNVCINWCSQVLHPYFVGLEIDRRLSDYTLCNCNFGGGQIPSDVSYADYDPDATHNETEPGLGEIQSSQGDRVEKCYVSIFS